MKIEPAFALLPVLTPTIGKPVVGSGFGVLMETSGSIDDGTQAAGFQARGMFGRHGATAAAAETRRPDLTFMPPTPQSAGPPRLEAETRPTVQGRPITAHLHTRQTAGVIRDPAHSPDPVQRGHTEGSTGGAVSGSDKLSPGEEHEASGAPRRRPSPPSLRRPEQVSLGKADEPGATRLIVRATSLDAQEIAEFRARAQALLRERGLALDKVRINGEDHPAVVAPRGNSQWP